ncbi:MAG: hypothetical protein KJO43_06500 [Phycisphaerae bacterium]|nr:hypothetical protein [Phycisphaerae bacterium]
MGSAPSPADGLMSLAELGIRTILSVDATPPPAAEAAKRGIRCVHVPIGYDAIGPDAAARIAKVLRDLPAPVFIHCHHGRYRGPAAAAFGLRALGLLDGDQALAAFAAAGDPDAYPGLRAAVTDAPAPSVAVLDALTNADLPPRARVGDMATLMAALDHHESNVGRIAAAGWTTPPDHPDLVAAAEAAAIVDHLRTAVELPPPDGVDPAEFVRHLRLTHAIARELEAAIVAARFAPAERQRRALAAACDRCHVRYRDAPPARTNGKHPAPARKP